MAAIRHQSWMIRHYGMQRSETQRLRRAQAIQRLGLELREAFAESDDFEPILSVLIEGLRPKEGSSF